MGSTGPAEPSEDGEMNEMTLLSRFTIKKVWGQARYLSVTEACHTTERKEW